jgi:hypothetical protein
MITAGKTSQPRIRLTTNRRFLINSDFCLMITLLISFRISYIAFDVPNLSGVFKNRAVAGKFACACHI